MASGQQKAKENLKTFQMWSATLSDDDFKQIIHRGKLNRGEIAKATGIGKSALNQNPSLKKTLEKLEDDLRSRGVLPTLTDAAKENKNQPKKYDNTSSKRLHESNRLSALEVENIELKAKVKELEIRLERFGELSETISEMGLMPR